MVSFGSYLLTALALTALALSLGFSAFRVRRHLLPAWEGAPARLLEAVLAIALLIWLAQLLGVFGLLYAPVLIAEALLLAVAVAVWPIGAPPQPGDGGQGREEAPRPPSASRGMAAVAGAVVALVFGHWGVATAEALDGGISIFDSLWYHMPFAAEIAQSHSVTALHYTDTVYTNWFYPQNSELLHAVGILFLGHDTLSLFLNFGWLALAFLAAWCIGRPYGRGSLAVVAVALVLESPTLIELQPGQAKNDIMAAALVLAALAILINAWTQRRRDPVQAPAHGAGESTAMGGALEPGWALAAAGLAAGLAAGTRVPVLAMVAALGVAAIVLAPAGRRLVAATWWSLPTLAGGGFWYARNLIAAGNPLPQVESLGPISLPHPEQLQSGRPDFSVAHYLTDTSVWRDYFVPGLEFTFGELWPLVFGGAIAGALLATVWGGDRARRWLGIVGLAGLLAYLLTPLGAGGPEGSPVAFGFNLRFAVPSLLAGLAALALVRDLKTPRRQWALLTALVAVLLVTNNSEAVLDHPDRAFGMLVAALAVLVPATLLLTRRPGDSPRSLAAPLCALGVVALTIGYGVQRDYLRERYGPNSGLPGYGLESAYAWAQDVSGARIGLAGTIAGLQGYGFYGSDLSNRVHFLGEKGPHGAFNPIPDCTGFRAAVNAAEFDYLVTAPFLDFIVRGRLRESPEAGWLAGEPAVEAIDRSGDVTVWQVGGRLDPAGCGPPDEPLEHIPRRPPL